MRFGPSGVVTFRGWCFIGLDLVCLDSVDASGVPSFRILWGCRELDLFIYRNGT